MDDHHKSNQSDIDRFEVAGTKGDLQRTENHLPDRRLGRVTMTSEMYITILSH
jgi:hypothetical protein